MAIHGVFFAFVVVTGPLYRFLFNANFPPIHVDGNAVTTNAIENQRGRTFAICGVIDTTIFATIAITVPVAPSITTWFIGLVDANLAVV